MKKHYLIIAVLVFFINSIIPESLVAQTNCVAPIGLTSSNVSQTSAYLYLSPTSTNTGTFNLQYHVSGTTTWTTVNNVSMPYQLGNLTCGTSYEWKLQQICISSPAGTTNTTLSTWSSGATFSTLACTPTCNAPVGLTSTNISQTVAVLNWTPTTTVANSYNIHYHAANSTVWTTVNNVSMPYQLGNLTCGTAYEWQVQQICTSNSVSGTVSAWSTGSAFSTLACTPVCNAPTGLTSTNVSQTGAYLYLSPTATNTGTFNLHYHISGATTWTTVNNITLPYQLSNLTCGTSYEWQVQQICTSSSATGTVSAWSTGSTFSTLACTPVCNAPTGLTSTNVSQAGVVLNWTPTTTVANSYNIHYHAANSTVWTTVNNVSMPYQLGNLTCGTAYEWQVQQICGTSISGSANTSLSAWSTGSAFSTLACTPVCNAPTGLTSTNVSQTGAYLYLSPTATNTGTFNLHYHISGATTWTTVNNITLPYQLSNLTCGTSYEWQVQQICTSSSAIGTVSAWSTGSTFSTLACTPVCNAPTGLTSTNVSQAGVVLNWTPTTTVANSYNIHYHAANSTVWTTVNNVSMPYQLGNLTCGSAYEWQVQQICTSNSATGTVSAWSTGSTFSTLACTPVCNAPIGLTSTNVSQAGAVLNWTPTTTVANSYNIHYHAANSTVWTTVNNVSMPYQLGNLTCGTAYEWQVQQICGTSISGSANTSLSAWSTGSAFSTLACTPVCNAPTGLTSTNVSQTGAYLYLSPTATNTGTFNLHYHISGATTWTTVNNITLPYQLGNLTCGTAYEWQVQQICTSNSATGTVSAWSTGSTFSTLACTPVCNAPIGLTSTNVSQAGAVLNWTPTTTVANSYNIHYHAANSTVWTTVNNVSMPYQLGNLTCGTAYEWQVQQICGTSISGSANTSLSAWSTGSAFSTLACTPVCNAPTGLTSTNVSQTGAVLNWSAVSGAYAYIIRYKRANNTAATYTTVTSSTTSVTIIGLSAGSYYAWQVQAVCANSPTSSVNNNPWSVIATFATPSVLVSPNPANQNVTVSFWADEITDTAVELRDSYGQLVSSKNDMSVQGYNTINVDTANFSEGLYFITVRNNSDTIISKVLIKH